MLKGTSGVLAFTATEITARRGVPVHPLRALRGRLPDVPEPGTPGPAAPARGRRRRARRPLLDCLECASCSFVCPSGIPLVHCIRVAKATVRGREEGLAMSCAPRARPARPTLPFLHSGQPPRGSCAKVFICALPVAGSAVWTFGIGALLSVVVPTAGAVGPSGCSSASAAPAAGPRRSAVLTGILLGLTLPPRMPLWMAFLGGAVAIGLGKPIWGGLGQNLFNPALVGRAFLQAAFPTAITTWAPPATATFHVGSSQLAPPLMSGERTRSAPPRRWAR